MAFGKKHTAVHKAFLALDRPYTPQKIYIAMCKLTGLKEEAIERGLGKLFVDGKLKSDEQRRAPKRSKPGRGPAPLNDFR